MNDALPVSITALAVLVAGTAVLPCRVVAATQGSKEAAMTTPGRIERVFIIHHTHVDLGYTAPRDQVYRDLADMVDRTIDLIDQHADRPEGERFKWVHEVSWPVLEYLKRDNARRDKLFDQMRKGLAELTAFYVNPTDLFDRRTLELSIDRAVALARQHDLPLTTAMFCDSPGVAWSVPDILAARKIRYLSAAPNLIMSQPLELRSPFWWEGPGGGRVLTWVTDHRTTWYAAGVYAFGLARRPHDEAGKCLLDYIRRLEGEGYRWSGLAIHHAMDNWPPEPKLVEFIAHFNAAGHGVRAELATHQDFFRYMESRHGDRFPVHRGAWPDWWASGNSSAAFESACSRQAKAALLRVSAAEGAFGVKADKALVEAGLEDILLFDEHTWGHESSVRQPWSPIARLEWLRKRSLALSGLLRAQQAEQAIIRQLPQQGEVLAANPFPTECSAIVRLKAADAKRPVPWLEDVSDGRRLAGQRTAAGQIAAPEGDWYAVTVPPCGFRHFRRAEAPPAVADAAGGGGQGGQELGNAHYRIRFDEASGRIESIRDAAAGRELCDAEAPWSFAELVHERLPEGSRERIYNSAVDAASPQAKPPRPTFLRTGGHAGKVECRTVRGPVFDALVTSGRLSDVEFTREVRLHKALPRIDMLYRLDKQVQTRYESLYVAFPLAMDKPEVRIENAGAVYRAGVEQLPGTATDWHSVGDYIAICDSRMTAILVPHDAPLVQVGDIHTGKWQMRLDVDRGHVYSWIMNNLWYTNFPAFQEGQVALAWSLTSRPGPFDAAAAEGFARDARIGLIVGDGGK